MNYQETIKSISEEINWDNWKEEPCSGEKEIWEVPEVLFCRLDWLKEQLLDSLDSDEYDEAEDTIRWCQMLLERLNNIGILKDY